MFIMEGQSSTLIIRRNISHINSVLAFIKTFNSLNFLSQVRI